MDYKQIQKIAKDTIKYIKSEIHSGMNLLEIRKKCEEKLLELGADSFWYWDVGALDFLGNLGHSIVKEKNDRIYIEKGNHHKLGEVAYFTFEPHISIVNSKYGYKKENIYYFENGKLVEL